MIRVPLALDPEYTMRVTVASSPDELPAAPATASVVEGLSLPSAGAVSVRLGANQSGAVVTVPVNASCAVKDAADVPTPEPAAARAASAPMTASRLTPGDPPRRSRRPRATGRRAPTGRRAGRGSR